MTTRPQRKHVPLRRCVACGSQFPQRELTRIVRTPEGQVAVDQGRKKLNGRGAYLCHKPDCWESALKRNRLEHALKGPIPPNAKEQLKEFAACLHNRV